MSPHTLKNSKLQAIPTRFEGAVMNAPQNDFILDSAVSNTENDSDFMDKQFNITESNDDFGKTKKYWTSELFKMIQKEPNLTYWAMMSETCICVQIQN